jgi:hypothetical protein
MDSKEYIFSLPDELVQMIINIMFGPDVYNLTCTCSSLRSFRPKYECDYKSFNVFVLKKCKNTYFNLAKFGVLKAFNFIGTKKIKELYFATELYTISYYSGNEDFIEYIGTFVSSYLRVPNLYYACKGGNIKFVNKLLDKYSDAKSHMNIQRGLQGACEDGHKDIVTLMVKHHDVLSDYDYKIGLVAACTNNHKEIADLLFDCVKSKGHDENVLSPFTKGHDIKKYYNAALRGASIGGTLNLMEYLIHLGANNFDKCLLVACEYNQAGAIHLLIKYGAQNIDEALKKSCKQNKLNAIKTLMLYESNCIEYFEKYIYNCASDIRQTILDFILQHEPKNTTHILMKIIMNMKVESASSDTGSSTSS